MNRNSFKRRRRSAALFLPPMLLLAGCQATVSSSDSARSTQTPYNAGTAIPADAKKHSFPLRFETHNFGAYCYNAYGCKVLYNNFYHVRTADDQLLPPPKPEHKDRWDGGYLDIRNFPSPAVVTWRSLDGVAHEAKVDIGAIFEDERILHGAAEQDIPQRAYIIAPDIILVINDRAVSVYMRARIPLKKPAIPGNKYSTFRDDLILAYTHTY